MTIEQRLDSLRSRLGMEETSASHLHQKARSRQPISVPFLWEEKPGKPKKDWKPETSPVLSVPIPVKLIASVPFHWEEKPGKPRADFLQHPPKILSLSSFSSSSCSSNPFDSSPSINFQRHGTPSESERETEEHEDGEDDGDEDDTLELDFATLSCRSDDTFHSAPFILANQYSTNKLMSNAIPVHEQFAVPPNGLQEENQDALQSPNSSFSTINDGERTSTGTGITRDCMLEFLFPLFAPHSGSIDRVLCQEKCTSAAPPSLLTKNSHCGLIGRKTPTLGELIILSRRLSNGRKGIPIKKQTHSLVIFQTSVTSFSFLCQTNYFQISLMPNFQFSCSVSFTSSI